MFDWFAKQFTNPGTVALVLGVRFLSYFSYSALVAAAVGLRSRLAVFAVASSVLSVLLTALVLHPGGLPDSAAAVDFLVHFTLPVLAGYAVSSNPTNERWLCFSILLVSTFFFLTLLLVLYGAGP